MAPHVDAQGDVGIPPMEGVDRRSDVPLPDVTVGSLGAGDEIGGNPQRAGTVGGGEERSVEEVLDVGSDGAQVFGRDGGEAVPLAKLTGGLG